MSAICRVCGCAYAPGDAASGRPCPRCLANVLRRRGALSLAIAVVAAAVLVRANSLPFLVVRQLGEQQNYSILGGSLELFSQGNALLGGAIFVFSFLFPFAKLLMLVLAAGTLPGLAVSTRRTLREATTFLGKWSMLDVFVAAGIIVVFKTGDMEVMRGIMDVQAGGGVAWFCWGVLLSGLAGFCLVVPEASADGPTPAGPAATVPKHRWWLAGLAGLLLLAGGLVTAMYLVPAAEEVAMVRAVRLSDAAVLPPILHTTYDLYLELDTPAGPLTTKTEHQAILGNGLTFPLPQPVALRDIRSISVWDARESTLWDKIHHREKLDQINEFGFAAKGSRFRFAMILADDIPWRRWGPLIAGYTASGLGVLLLMVVLVPWLQGRRM